MIRVVEHYMLYLDELKDIIASSPFKTKFIYETIGVNKPTFYRKLKEKTFTPEEVMRLTRLLYPKETLLSELKEAQQEYKAGKGIDHETAMDMLRKQFS